MGLANNQGRNRNCAREYVMNVTWGLLQPPAIWTRPPQGQKKGHKDLKLAFVMGRVQQAAGSHDCFVTTSQ